MCKMNLAKSADGAGEQYAGGKNYMSVQSSGAIEEAATEATDRFGV